jgi:hypothetical protein
VVALDLAEGILRDEGSGGTLLRQFHASAPTQRPSAAGCQADLVFSNLMLQWCNGRTPSSRECRRVLNPADC